VGVSGRGGGSRISHQKSSGFAKCWIHVCVCVCVCGLVRLLACVCL